MALSGIAQPTRALGDGRRVRARVEDNTVLLLDFGQARFGVVQTGFTFQRTEDRATIEIIGTEGTINFLGWDWAPRGIEVYANKTGKWETRATDQRGYHWRNGASDLARCLATGERPAQSAAHAYHVLEAMLGAVRSARTGRQIHLRSQFPYPLYSRSG
jgi:predicted dehydrogenase